MLPSFDERKALMGCRQVVRQRFLVSSCAGSNPATPILSTHLRMRDDGRGESL
jgi:hypothetical protein